MNFQYPHSVYDTPRNLLTVLGTFWAETYVGRDQIEAFSAAKAQVETQSMVDLMETIEAIARTSVPIYHVDNWYFLAILRSERNDAQTSLLKYGDGALYDRGYQYDVPVDGYLHAWPLPENCSDVNLIMNRFSGPSMTLVKDLDFIIDRTSNAIIFRENPFDDVRVAQRDIYENGMVTDREAALWLFRGDFDWDTIYRQFGYVIGLRLQSSEGYRDLLNAVFDALVGGTARKQIEQAFSAMTGVPLVQETSEVVEALPLDHSHRLVITDQHVYKFDPAMTVLVEEGDTVHAGDALTDALQFFEFNRGVLPDDLRSLALDEGFLSACYYGDIVFENRSVPLTVITDDPSGFTKITFPLGGFPLDVEQFFDELHARGVAAVEPVDECDDSEVVLYPEPLAQGGCDDEGDPPVPTYIRVRRGTFAHLLDLREERVGEPTAAHLPTHINPLLFLIQNILRNNCFLVKVRTAGVGRDAVGLHNARLLPRLTPPHTALLLLVELAVEAESVTIDHVDEGIPVTYRAGSQSSEIPASSVDDSRITARLVSGTCQ